MKTILTLILFTSIQDHADIIPAWDRPIFKATLDIALVSGEMKGLQTAILTLTRKDGSGESGLTLEIDGNSIQFQVLERRLGECGVAETLAQAREGFNPNDMTVR
jgi:hypothetical protein